MKSLPQYIPQTRFNRAQRTIEQPELPERLQRLNRELGPDQTKTFDYLYAIHDGLRFRVCVMRDEDNKFFATTQIGTKAFRIEGGSPSGAFWMLSITMRVHLASLLSSERQQFLTGRDTNT